MNIQRQSTVSLPVSGSRGAVNPQFHKPAFRVRGSLSRRCARVLDLNGRHVRPACERRERGLQSCGSNGPRRILMDLLIRVKCIEAELAAMQITADDAERLVGG